MMNTRKNRKRTWKVQEAQESQEEDEAAVAEQPLKESTSVVMKKAELQQQQDSNRLLLFLQSWQEAKEAQVKGTLQRDMPESIALLMQKKGYPISINVARTKIMNFIKKYNLVKKMAAQGKPNEWTHFNTVKKILEFGPPILPSANVIIPIENIKTEEKASFKGNTMKIAERKISVDTGASSIKSKKEIDLIEIADEDPQQLKPRVYFSESEHVDESDDSDLSDEDLDFENPLDKISFGFHPENGAKLKQSTVLPPPPKMAKLEKVVKNPLIPGLNKIEDNAKKSFVIPNKPLAQASSIPILPKPQIIPLPKNLNIPQTHNNGMPQQYLIVRPLNPGNPNQAKTLAIPMGGQFKMGVKSEGSNAQITNKTPIVVNSDTKKMNNQVKMLNIPKIPAQITMSSPPPLVSASSGATTTTSTNNNEQSPCSSPGSNNVSPSVRQLLSNVIQLETNIYNLQQERLRLERERFEMERDYGKEMISIFKEIKEKLCDAISVPTATPIISNKESEEKKKE